MIAGRSLTASQVRDIVLAGLERRDGNAGPWQVEGPVVEARVSAIYKAHSPGSPFPLAVKIYHPGRADRLEEQGELLRRYNAAFADSPRFAVPQFRAVLPEHRTLVMEWIDEPPLARLLREAGRRRERRAELFAATGRWLRAFHDASGIRMLPLAAADLTRAIDGMLGKSGAAERVPSAAFRRAYATLLARLGEFDGRPAPHAGWHGDFTPNNIFHGPARTVGIDLTSSAVKPVTHDICRFLVQAETVKPFLTRTSTLHALGIERADLEGFLAAYDPDRSILDPKMLGFLQLAESLRRWATLFGRPKRKLVRGLKHFRLRRMTMMAAAAVDAGSSFKAH